MPQVWPWKEKKERKKEWYYRMIKGSIQQKGKTIVNVYILNIRALKYIQQILTNIKGEINSNTTIIGNLTALLQQ